ncbi:MAG: hypothetical protein U1D55_11345 [Phycisphaerae bacterium]
MRTPDEIRPAVTRPTLLSVISTPIWGVLRPRAVAETLLAAKAWQFWLMFASATILIAAAAVVVVLAERAQEYGRLMRGSGFNIQRAELSEVLPQIWNDAHSRGPIGWIELSFLGLIGGLLLGAAILTWLLLPVVHRAGSVAGAIASTFRVVCGGAGILLLGAAAVALDLFGLDENGDSRAFITIITIQLTCVCLIVWLQRAIRVTAERQPAIAMPPRCEGCGYDLTHQPVNGLCPECRTPADESLTYGARRRLTEWEERPSISSWLRDSLRAILFPARFYRSIALREDLGARRVFATWQCRGVWAATFATILVLATTTRHGPPSRELPYFATVMSLLAALLCWTTHRAAFALLATVWIARGYLPDLRWAERVLLYESAYLWLFVLHNGIAIGSFIIFEDWISRMLGYAFFMRAFGMPAEVIVLLGGDIALAILWLLRLRIAGAAIRWSNF